MAHLTYAEHRRGDTPPEWLKVGAEIAQLANEWSGRDDLVAYVGEGAGSIAPACYIPNLAEIEVNVHIAFGNGVEPAEIGSLLDRSNRYTWARACGAIYHEALHARFTAYDMKVAYDALKPEVYEALMLLEEGRIEGFGAALDKGSRVFLRACAMDIVIGDAAESFEANANVRSVAQLVALIYPRVFAEILDADEVRPLTDLIESFLGTDLVDALCDLIRKAQAHDNHRNAEALYPVAEEWVRLVREAAEEAGETDEPSGGEPGEDGTPVPGSSGSGEPSEASKALAEAIREAMQEIAEAVEIANFDELAEQQEAEAWREMAADKASRTKERHANEGVAVKVFARSPEGGGASGSMLIKTRAPEPAERSAAITVARQLDKAKYRERDITEVSSVLPPGRLRTRGVVQAAAQKAAGRMATTEPWRRKTRKHTDEPTLTIGMMVDISGSMGSAMEPMATTAYVMSEAGRRVQARSAMVYFGNTVFPVLKPGERQHDVRVYTAPDGTEKFNEAFRALDGSLNLLYGSGARLLVVVSDACYTSEEIASARRWLQRCKDEGVAVLWLPFDHGRYVEDVAKGLPNVSVVAGRLDPAAAAMQIGKAAAEALTVVGRR